MPFRFLFYVIMAASVAAFAGLIVANGFTDILRGIAMVGWGLAALVAIRLVSLALAGIAWRSILGDAAGRGVAVYVGLRIVREAINSLLPVMQVGGDMIGGRLLAKEGVPGGAAAASILVDLLLQTVTQGVLAVAGLATLRFACGDSPAVREIGGTLIVAVPALAGFFMAQRLGLFALLDRGMAAAMRFWPALANNRPLDLQPALRRLYADRRGLAVASAFHVLAWTLGIAEIWVVLSGMRLAPSAAECLVLESLGQAVRSAAFTVPGALGVQEGGFILLGGLFGLSPAASIALSIAKRLPDIAIGVPGLVAWQWLESRRLLGHGALAVPPADRAG